MTKHTPGPWHVGCGRASHIVYAADGYAVADAKTFHLKHESADANARLIAAAPDMLAALELAKSIVERLWPFEFDYEREAEKAINDAIAKAKGE